MARNQEKAMLMFNRWTAMKESMEKGTDQQSTRRPFLASECKSLPDAERWRRQIIHEITRKVTEIQNAGLGEARIRDLNDEINKLIREKYHWEKQIKVLGGNDYTTGSHNIAILNPDQDGKELPGSRGYKYFGVAKDLPGVKELFEEAETLASLSSQRLRKTDIMKTITPDYYGYRDEDDGILIPLELQRTEELRNSLHQAWLQEQELKQKEALSSGTTSLSSSSSSSSSTFHSSIPSTIAVSDIGDLLADRKRQILIEKYTSPDLLKEQQQHNH